MSEPFAVAMAASAAFPEERAAAIAAPYLAALEALGGCRAPAPGPTLWLAITGGSEEALLAGWDRRGPLLLVAHPGHNSLPACLEALAAARAEGGRGRIAYLGGPGDRAGFGAVAVMVGDVAAAAALRRSRLGLVGAPSSWLVASRPDLEVVRRSWGPEVVAVGMERFLAACRAASLEGASGGGVEAALRALVREERLDAVTVRCFDLIGALEATACLALSALNDEGVAAACEGDLPSAVAMLWLRLLVGSAAWMANPVRLDAAAGAITLAHCTVPRSLVADSRVDTHFESGVGTALAGELPRGPVTLVRVGGPRLDRLRLAEGTVVGSGAEPDLCRTQATVRVGREVVEGLLTAPLGNHLVVVPGHHAGRLAGWWTLCGPGTPAAGP